MPDPVSDIQSLLARVKVLERDCESLVERVLALMASSDRRLNAIEGWINKHQIDMDGGCGPCVPVEAGQQEAWEAELAKRDLRPTDKEVLRPEV